MMKVAQEDKHTPGGINTGEDNLSGNFVGDSESFQEIQGLIKKIAPYRSPVCVIGETGTGKEIVARKVHSNSNRCNNKFFAVNCGAISRDLFESQLFGHLKGAFTGAQSNMLGYFRAAEGGTLFLDEITQLDLDQQAKLLRVLEEKAVRPVGATRLYPVDVRIICATNEDIKKAVRKGEFRADLYFRLNVVQLHIPPLCERRKDILLLAEHFLKKQAQLYGEPYKGISEHTKDLLTSYKWPGNVRELANVIEYAYITSDQPVIDLHSLPPSVFTEEKMETQQDTAQVKSLDQVNRETVANALDRNNGRKTNAAKELQISYRKLTSLINKYSIQPKDPA